jgi:hypothetical protein
MVQGLNVTLSVIRRNETVDAVGGAIYTEATVVSGVAARLGNASRSQQMLLKEMGYEATRANQIIAQPSDLNVVENDHVLLNGGQYNGLRFIVLSIRRDNLPASDTRSHVELIVERLVSARSEP